MLFRSVLVDGVFTLNRQGLVPAGNFDPELKSLAEAVLRDGNAEAGER